MATAEEVADLLDKAHDELLVRGWYKGNFEGATGAVCAWGAINYAATGEACPSGLPNLPVAAIIALQDTIGSKSVPEWNDAKDRTADEVFDAFKATAKRLREEAQQ